MKTQHRHRQPDLPALARTASRLPAPADYYHGCRAPALRIPNNILLFCRHSATELHDGSLQPHFHHRWVLVIPLAGVGTVLVDENQYRLRPGRTLLVSPLRLHRYRDVQAGKICWLFVTFEWPSVQAEAAVPELGVLSLAAQRHLSAVLRLWQEQPATPESAAELAAHTALLLLTVRRAAPTAESAPAALAADLLRKINDWLQTHREQPVVLAEMARGIGWSESHLRAVFRQQFGISLGRYVRETRCRQAALRLRDGGLTVTEAAAACGFSSVYTFSRTFKRVLGTTPSSLRPRND